MSPILDSSLFWPTKEKLLMSMYANERKGVYMGVTQLAKTLHLSKSTVGGHLAELAELKTPMVEKVCVGDEPGHERWVLTDPGRGRAKECVARGIRDGGRIAAGPAVPDGEGSSDGTFVFPLIDLPPGDYTAYSVVGDSMEGPPYYIREGDTVIIRKLRNGEVPADGAIIAARVPEGTDVTLPGWQERMKRSEGVNPLSFDHITLKAGSEDTLEGSSGAGSIIYKPVGYEPAGVLVWVLRQFHDGKIFTKTRGPS